MTKDSTEAFSFEDYTIAVVCALHKELFAVRALFDSRHKDLPTALQDSNHYALGQMGQHHIVAACLPSGQYGTNSASDVVSHMVRSFPCVTFCLSVGIGGGVPSKMNDIRLGDVVVSQPIDAFQGVLQYDLGKALENGLFVQTGVLQRPPRHLMTAISSLASDPDLPSNPLGPYLDQIAARNPAYRHPGQHLDVLFASEYTHDLSSNTCDRCDGPRIERDPRNSDHPVIHYGLIASGNHVVKSAHLRDRLGDRYNILCFEMEAAGVMNSIQCLVIRGICDYADSHRNKIWQEYASATAAAYAKLLLSFLKPSSVSTLQRLASAIEKSGLCTLQLPSLWTFPADPSVWNRGMTISFHPWLFLQGC